MTDLRQAAMQALEALEWSWGGEPLGTMELNAITALKAALEQPEQGPVAWMVKLGDVTCFQHHADSKHASVPLYTTPPAAEPEQEPVGWYHNDFGEVELSRIPRAGWSPLYTTPPAARPEQEPVGEVLNERGEIDYISYVPPVGTRLYTTPPAAQRPWQGLTEHEINDVSQHYTEAEGFQHGAKWAELKLKERNT